MAKRVSATVAKNQLGQILRMAEEEPVYIVKHGKPQSVVIAADRYESLVAQAQDKGDLQLENLRSEFETMYASMQTSRWRRGMNAMLAASAEELNRTAARRIRKARG